MTTIDPHADAHPDPGGDPSADPSADPGTRPGDVPPSTRRLVGLDLARGLALIGMIWAHLPVGPTEPIDWSDPGTWGAVVEGRSSLLFATVAGVSLGLMTRAAVASGADGRRLARRRVAVRAALLAVLGLALVLLDAGPLIILIPYALLFVVCLPVLGWSCRRLVVAAIVVGLTAPVLNGGVTLGLARLGYGPRLRVEGEPATASFWHELVGHATGYQLPTYLACLLTGLALSRVRSADRRVALRVTGVGAALAVVGYTLGQAFGGRAFFPLPPGVTLPPGVSLPGGDSPSSPFALEALFTAWPHSGSYVDSIGALGFVVAVIGLCSLVGGVASRAVQGAIAPVVRVGRLPLTLYVAHLVVIACLPDDLEPGLAAPVAVTLGALVVAVGWTSLVGTGPLEAASSRVVAHVAPATPGGQRVRSR